MQLLHEKTRRRERGFLWGVPLAKEQHENKNRFCFLRNDKARGILVSLAVVFAGMGHLLGERKAHFS
jgi:hypothetical protein